MEELKPLSTLESKDNKVERICKHCSHKWLGVKSSTICPKCKKYIGAVKDIKSDSDSGIKIESVGGTLPPLPSLKQESGGEPSIPESGEQTEADIPASTYTDIISYPFDMIAERTGREYIKLTRKEKDTLAPLLKKVGDKWVGKWFDKYPEEGALALTFGMIILGKITLEATYRKDKKEGKPSYEEERKAFLEKKKK